MRVLAFVTKEFTLDICNNYFCTEIRHKYLMNNYEHNRGDTKACVILS